MLSPKRTKYRKQHKGRIHGMSKGGTALNFGTFGLKALEPERITARQIESARRAITRAMKRAGPRVDPYFPGCAGFDQAGRSPHGFRQGLAGVLGRRVAPGRIMFEIDGVTPELAREALTLGAAKLPIKTKFIARIGDG